MSDIIVRGMEMPDNCSDCRFESEVGFCRAKPDNFCGYTDDIKRPEWCPLIEIPPHGNLIDGDELEQRLEVCITEGMSATKAFEFKHIIEEQPVIISEERSE